MLADKVSRVKVPPSLFPPFLKLLRNDKASVYFVLAEAANDFVECPQHRGNLMGGAIAQPDPDDFGRKSEKEATLMEFRVLRNDGEVPEPRKFPDDLIIGTLQAERSDVRRTGVERGQHFDQTVREVLVEWELHEVTVSSFRSRSAAKARQALISSAVRSGKSRRISS